MKSQFLTLLIIGSVCLFLGIALFIYFHPHNQSKPSTSPTPSATPNLIISTPTPTPQFSNWRLYQNPKYNYQFKYDPNWTLTDTVLNHPRYDSVVLQQDNHQLIRIDMLKLKPAPVTIEELLDQLRSQLSLPSSAFQTLNFGRQQIYGLRLIQPSQTDYYFLHQGLTFRITFFGYSPSRLPQAQLHFLETLSLL